MQQFSHSAQGGIGMENEHMTAHDSDGEMCIHHWLINERNFGVCKKCGESKQFSSGSWYDASLKKTSQTKSSKVTQVVPDTKG
jgi:DNA-directed RNA polymerase subunit M/transcription elongation factor TFIIS